MAKLLNINKFGITLIVLGAVAQLAAFFVNDESPIALISGLAGLVSVVLCSERKMAFYVFGFIQLITYCILAWEQRFYGELVENIFYAVTMVVGIFIWLAHYDHEERQVEVRELSILHMTLLVVGTIIVTQACYIILSITNDTQPLLDAVTTIPAIVAQVLMILRYREQWWFWLTIDLGSIVMWAVADNRIMVAQFIIWSLNCIYGIHLWKNKQIIN